MTATPWVHGRSATLRSCCCAACSTVVGSAHMRTGALVPGMISMPEWSRIRCDGASD